jgi:hypothetical protein
MFDRWRHTTLRDGARGSGTVADASETRLMAPVVTSEVYEYRRTIRVTFPDGSVVEVEERIPLHRVQQLADRRTIDCWPELAERTKIGAVVPVRYDESDHSHVVLDLPALIDEILSDLDRSAGA